MKRTFGERRARARGEVSHDLLSLLFLFVYVCARLRLKKKLSSQKAPFPSLVPFPAFRRRLFIPIFSLARAVC